MSRRLGTAFVLALALSAAAEAHHSLAGMYESSRITLEGTIDQFQFVNPHPYIIVDVNTAGSATLWKGELDNRRELLDIGMSPTSFMAGDRVIITGSPGRDRAQSMYVWRLERPGDGFLYEQIGTSPRVSRVRR